MRTSKSFKNIITQLVKHFIGKEEIPEWLKLHLEGYDDLNIEQFMPGMISVAHIYTQEGDVMYDPEVVFWIGPDGEWYPAEYVNSGLGLDQEIIRFDDNGKPERFNPKLQNDVASFCGEWAKNLRDQDWTTATRTDNR